MSSVSVFLVEDSPILRLALASVLSRNGRQKFTVRTTDSAHVTKCRVTATVVIIDAVTWAGSNGKLLEVVQRLSDIAPVILLGREELLVKYPDVLIAGAAGFIRQTAPIPDLTGAVTAVASGRVWFDRQLLKKILHGSSLAKQPRGIRFNRNELEIVDLIARGKTNKEIGVCVGLTERTVKAYVSALFHKTGASNRSSLATYAILNELTKFRTAW